MGRPVGHLARILVIADLAVLVAAFVLAYRWRFGVLPFEGSAAHTSAHLVMALGAVAGWMPALFLFDLYEGTRFRSPWRVFTRVAKAAVVAVVITAAILYLFQSKLASRFVFGTQFAIAALFVWTLRVAIGRMADALGRRVLVVGHEVEAKHIAALLQDAEVVARVDTDTAELSATLDRLPVDHVVIAVEPGAWEKVPPLIAVCAEVGVDVSLAAPSVDLQGAIPDRLFGLPVLRLHGSAHYRAAALGKRAFDLVVGTLMLVLAGPVILAAALVVKLTSRGPVMFVQERLGLHGRRFRMYKLRTMVVGAEEQRPELEPLNEVGGPAFKLTGDPRVTRVGRVLRRYSIDELPQLVNVLRGDMSLVGPRPPLPTEVDRYDRWQRRRLAMQPGLTCTWQVSGRSEIDFDEWVQLDLDYVDNWSPWLDLKILLRTVPAVMSGRGAR